MVKRLLKAKDLSDILGCGKTKAYQLMNSRTFPSIRIGKNLYVDEEKLSQWLDRYTYKTYVI